MTRSTCLNFQQKESWVKSETEYSRNKFKPRMRKQFHSQIVDWKNGKFN